MTKIYEVKTDVEVVETRHNGLSKYTLSRVTYSHQDGIYGVEYHLDQSGWYLPRVRHTLEEGLRLLELAAG